MRRILIPGGLSLLLYALGFGLLLDRPLSLGPPRQQIEAKLARGATIPGRKLVIIAGSNGPYSHRCETIEPLIGFACVNAGVAVGIGLDYLFARWQPLLRPGDVVYLPLEEAQYTTARLASRLGPDAAIMARHDRATLAHMPPERQIAALFAFDLRAAIMSLIETALVLGHFHDPREAAIGATNAWGDHVGHTLTLAAPNRAVLAAASPVHATPEHIRAGEGRRQVALFLDWAAAHQVRVIGGWPTGFADSPIPLATAAAIHAVFAAPGADFLELETQARYGREAFFDTPDHLHEPAQIAHSLRVGAGLRALLADERVTAAAGSGPCR